MGKTVFLGIPHRGAIEAGTMEASFKTGIPIGKWEGVDLNTYSSSLLAYTFNHLWCNALNNRAEKNLSAFCMLHSDIAPEPNWLATLLEERERTGADVLSAVIPIKDDRGYSSTAVYNPKEDHLQRVTMKEATKLPKTFDASDFGIPDGSILPNTGLWVCDFTKPWVEEVCFEVRDRIFKDKGLFVPQCLSEDWNFGYWCRRKGLKVLATTLVKAVHKGTFDYPNYVAFGSEETDTGFGHFPGAADGSMVTGGKD